MKIAYPFFDKGEKMSTVNNKKQKRVPTGYALKSDYFGASKADQTGVLRVGQYATNGLSVKAGIIYKEDTPQFVAIQKLSELLRRKMFNISTFKLVDVED